MLGEAKLDELSHTLVGERVNVLFESQKDGVWEGYCPQFVKVKVQSKEDLSNQIRAVQVMSWKGKSLEGFIL